MKLPSEIEQMLAVHIRADKLPPPEREYMPNPKRKWRIDFAYPTLKIAIEVDGAVHRIRERFHADIEKHAWLVLNGWTLLRVGGREVRSGKAIEWVKALLWDRAPLSFWPQPAVAPPRIGSHAASSDACRTLPDDVSEPAYAGQQ